MVDLNAHSPKENFEQFSHRTSSSKIFEQDPGAWANHDKASIGQLNREVTAASRINFFSREELISALCDAWRLRPGGQ